jgi:hypothetical protein
MATGKLGANDLAATTLTTVYTCPAATYSVVSINICNRGTSTTGVRIAIADSDTPSAAEYIEYDTEVFSKNVLERTGIVLAATQRIVVYSTQASVSAVVVGIETVA